ncbi:hypothetical protein [uncultured Shewanella sp.]|uniref:hypothetical protein n=1 Tax=uncultured Shewanella sp. TaxID=173975 RepID=UPI00344BEEB1
MPFVRWPNNDLWNLLPSRARLQQSETRICDWWQQAWLGSDSHNLQSDYLESRHTYTQRFFAQANLALPGLTQTNRSVSDVFEAMLLQRVRLKEMQQLREW